MKQFPRILAWLVFAVFFSAFCFILWVVLGHDYDWTAIRPYWKNLLSGWTYTLLLSAVALVLSIAAGIFLTIGQLIPFRPTYVLARIYIEFVRGTPLLVLILIGYYIVANSIGWDHRLSFGIVILALFGAAYLAEIFRAGVESIPKSQWTAARAIGLSDWQTYQYVVIPQTVKRVLPASAGQFANLIKDSSLLYLISVPEFLMQARETNSNTHATFESFLPLAVGYLILTIPISAWSRHLEARFKYEQ